MALEMSDSDQGSLDIFGTRLKNSPRGPTVILDGAKMTVIRALKGISLDMLVGLTGRTPQELRAMEAEQLEVDSATLRRLGQVLDCRPEDLIKREKS